MSEIPLLANMPVQSDFPFFHDYLLFKMLKYKTPNILPNGKTTEGLVQQGLANMRAGFFLLKMVKHQKCCFCHKEV
jgi:hypothetical protein